MCGSSVATAATLGRVSIPEMLKAGYSHQLAAGAVAAGGTLGILIPPSLILMIYAIIAQQSVSKLFAAALIPGLILTALYIVVEIALIHPPVGMSLFVIRAQAPEIDIRAMYLGVLPFLVAPLILIVLLIAYPEIALWLPRHVRWAAAKWAARGTIGLRCRCQPRGARAHRATTTLPRYTMFVRSAKSPGSSRRLRRLHAAVSTHRHGSRSLPSRRGPRRSGAPSPSAS